MSLHLHPLTTPGCVLSTPTLTSAALTKVHPETGGTLNTITHNAGHGSLEAFSTQYLHQLY
jgi:hypothetical protein